MKKILLFFSVNLLLATIILFSVARVKTPVLSHPSGFYDKPFILKMVAGVGDNLYYTLDGSLPCEDNPSNILYNSKKKDVGISIYDFSVNPNTISMRTDLTVPPVSGSRFMPPSEPIDKACVVRVAAQNRFTKKWSKDVIATYFVDYSEKNYANFPVISIVTSPENFFDYEKGIYITGKTFDEYIGTDEWSKHQDENGWRFWKGNFTNKGPEWERECHIQFFEPDISADGISSCSAHIGNLSNILFTEDNKRLTIDQTVGIRIHGGLTRSYAQKSFSIYARDRYEGLDKFQASPLMGHCNKKFYLNNFSQDYKLKVTESFTNELCRGLSFNTALSRYVYVYLNGEYWGLYSLAEDPDQPYIEENFFISEKNLVYYKAGELKSDSLVGKKLVEELNYLPDRYDLSTDEGYKQAARIIDMDSFIQYYAVMAYLDRCGDWPGDNEACWRTISSASGKYNDGRWRWVMYDINWGAYTDYESDSIAYIIDNSHLFAELWKNPRFKEEYLNQLEWITTEFFSTERTLPLLQQMTSLTHDSVIRDLYRFYGGTKDESDYQKEYDNLVKFLTNREAFLLDIINAYR